MRVAAVSVLMTEPLVMPLGVCVLSVADELVFVPSDVPLFVPLLQLIKTATMTQAKRYFFIITSIKLFQNLILHFYQNRTYSTDRIIRINTIIVRLAASTLNIPFSSTNAFGFTFGPARLITTISNTVNTNARPIQMWNGISYWPASFL